MDQTPRGYPYPECEPPLVQDASFIGQLQALAEAVDADMTAIEAQANEELIMPLCARLRESAAVPRVGQLVTGLYDTTEFASPGMDDLSNNGIRITRSGWYYIGTFTVLLIPSAVELNTRTRFIRNGAPLTQGSDQARLASATAEDPYQSATVFLTEGDLINTQILHNGAAGTAYTTQSRIWALLLTAA
ncbi:hypothetical protein [Streptomyces sp. NPDC046332]|uniref:hypothetical protein n=1 Tax=unclassified Streptomyces TaxID=2593676 RepID=UPI003406E26B